MRKRRRLFLLVLCVGAAVSACDPGAYLRIRQPVAPPGIIDCVAAALDRSPLVAFAERVGSLPDFRVSLRDSVPLIAPGGGTASVSLDMDDGDATALLIEYFWVPNAEGNPTPAQEQRMIATGIALADELRTECLPGVPRNVSCVTGYLFSSDPCSP